MQKTFEKKFLADFGQLLCDRKSKKPFSLSKKDLNTLLAREEWLEKATTIRQNLGQISWEQALFLSKRTLEKLSRAPKDGWLDFTYRFALDLMFPCENFNEERSQYGDGALFLLSLMQLVYSAERKEGLIPPSVDTQTLDKEACLGEETAEEYLSLCRVAKREFIYEMMRLSHELLPYHTLEHITNVHRMALHCAKELKEAGTPVDLCLISGAAIVHDIGKFGCKEGERVPYLHYYYTDLWCRKRHLRTIGHIAANHSVWDLELENLSVESLLLIYADFRVKQLMENGKERTAIFSLKDSFDVILSKLDQVDDAKRCRYRKVYAKLKDFEDYMRSLGVDVEMTGCGRKEIPIKEVPLLLGNESVNRLKRMGVEHNIALMHCLSSDQRFGNILEAARSEKKWNNIRAYLGVFDEYFTYLDINQKVQLLDFLYELLMNKEGDIRRQAAALLGNIIAKFDISYKKELPENVIRHDDVTAMQMWSKYLDAIIHPDYKLTPQHKSWIGFTLKIVISSFFLHCSPSDRRPFMAYLLSCFTDEALQENTVTFVLLDALNYLPLDYCTEEERSHLIRFAVAAAGSPAANLRSVALRTLDYLTASDVTLTEADRSCILDFCLNPHPGDEISLQVLEQNILASLGAEGQKQAPVITGDVISDVFLDNLKLATPWVIKTLNVALLRQVAEKDPKSPYILHIAAHFSNLLKISERVVVRHKAGEALLNIAPLLAFDQRNEIAMELLKGLEVGEFEFSKYIPEYLGQLALWLPPEELDELIYQLSGLTSSSNTSVVSASMSTLGVILEHYPLYSRRFTETKEIAEARCDHLLGILLKGLSGHLSAVQQEAMLVIGHHIFASPWLPEENKRQIFSKCCKKLLALLCDKQEGELTFFYRAAALNNIYRFINDSQLNYGDFTIEQLEKVAFFPGTFDPFSLSHKGIVEAILEKGFEVMLAIDEFSWSKKTQPHLIRRRIANMSLADKFHVYIYPDSMPVNLANPEDLTMLRDSLTGRKISIVVGSDVVSHASSYLAPPEPGSIHEFDHIIFLRSREIADADTVAQTDLSCISGDIFRLSLPVYLEEISSSRIRDNIDHNRDISNQVDPMVQDYIYYHNLYLREPQYKPLQFLPTSQFRYIETPSRQELLQLLDHLRPERADGNRSAAANMIKQGNSLIVMQKNTNPSDPLGMIFLHERHVAHLMPLLDHVTLTDKIRRQQAGRLLLITGIYLEADDPVTAQILLTEALDKGLRSGCTHALFYATDAVPPTVMDVLIRQGFIIMEGSDSRRPLFIVDIRDPLVLIRNIETTLKAPFSTSPVVLGAARHAHWHLQSAMTGLKPGHLVLSLDSAMMHQRLIERITQLNGVPAQPTHPRMLGPQMCVPFGKLLRSRRIPNTVTKTLHTDKVYDPDVNLFTVEAYPNYSSLENQIRVIKSFCRPVIMVDDLLHSAHRIKALSPLFNAQDIDISTVLVGILSGRGRDLMNTLGHKVEGIYYVPNLEAWYVESTLYPFIGGDTIRRPWAAVNNLLPSVNLILPYASIHIHNQFPRQAIFNYSLACLENARNIMQALETEYLARFGRILTLNRLSEVVILPVVPDKGRMQYDYNLTASVYIENDIEMLMRTENLFR